MEHLPQKRRTANRWNSALLAMALVAVASPNAAGTTRYVVSLPGLVRAPALLLALFLLLCLLNSLELGCPKPRGFRNALGFASLATVSFEVTCLAAQRMSAEWNYLSVAAWMPPIESLLKIAVLMLSVACFRDDASIIEPKDKKVIGAQYSLISIYALTVYILQRQFDIDWASPEETLSLTLASWATLVALLGAIEVVRSRMGLPFIQTLMYFLTGCLIGNALCRCLDFDWIDLRYAFLMCIGALGLLSFASFSLKSARPLETKAPANGLAGNGEEERLLREISKLKNAETLSKRETQVLLLSLEGIPTAEISARLGIKAQTIATYRARINAKLGVGSHDELIGRLVDSNVGAGQIAERPIKRASSTRRLAVAAIACATTFFVIVRALSWAPDAVRDCTLLMLGVALLAIGEFGFDNAERVGLVRSVAAVLGSGAAVGILGVFGLRSPDHLFFAYVLVEALALALLFMCASRTKGMRTICLMALGGFGLALVGKSAFEIRPAMSLFASTLAILCSCALLWVDKQMTAKVLADVVLVGEERAVSYLRGRGLSELETSVSLLSAKGLPRAGIAGSLNISVATVSSYRDRAIKKLGVDRFSDVAELIRKEAGMA